MIKEAAVEIGSRVVLGAESSKASLHASCFRKHSFKLGNEEHDGDDFDGVAGKKRNHAYREGCAEGHFRNGAEPDRAEQIENDGACEHAGCHPEKLGKAVFLSAEQMVDETGEEGERKVTDKIAAGHGGDMGKTAGERRKYRDADGT